MKYKVGDNVFVRKPYYTNAKIHRISPDGSIGLEINGHKIYSVREKHIVKKLEEVK